MAWKVVEDGPMVVARFEGFLDAEDGRAAAAAFAEFLASEPRDVVFEVQTMTGYDGGARRAWQEQLWPVRKNIRSMRLVGGNALVRMGATLMAGFLRVPLEVDEAAASE